MDEVPAPADAASMLDRLSALCDPVRRDAYFFVADRGGWVSRDETANALGVRRGLVAHHLDRLAADGLLDVEYRRLTGRSGPGAGRPAKLYRRSDARFAVTIPPRNPVALGEVLAGALADAGDAGVAVRDRALERARSAGDAIGRGARGPSGRDCRQELSQVLSRYGYAPYETDGELALGNCPYEPLAGAHRDVVCAVNLALIEGAVAGAGVRSASCRLQPPTDGECCVRVAPWPGGTDPT